MSVLKICEYPDPILKEKAQKVTKIDDNIKGLLDDMLETMYAAQGVGLAAPQIGILQRLVVIDVEQDKENSKGNPVYMINPEITWRSEEISVCAEGCLSVPQQRADVERPASVKLKYTDKDGTEHEILAEGFFATAVQHELDHLDGILYIDHISRLKRNMLLKKLKKYREEQKEEEN